MKKSEADSSYAMLKRFVENGPLKTIADSMAANDEEFSVKQPIVMYRRRADVLGEWLAIVLDPYLEEIHLMTVDAMDAVEKRCDHIILPADQVTFLVKALHVAEIL